MNIGRMVDDEFQDWYDNEHLPERQRVPGFLVCGGLDQRLGAARVRGPLPPDHARGAGDGRVEQARVIHLTTQLQLHFRDHLCLVLRRYVPRSR
jgi:hypothetical protein